ncbi:MAG: hypothetical protein R6U15_08140 [Candidatus Izemoplasmatales bacterium]
MNLTLANTLINSVNLNGEGPAPSPEFIIEVDTTKSGTSNSNQFEFSGAVGEYDVEAYQNDSLVSSFSDLVNQQTITLPSSGIYELRVIPKGAGFDKMKFGYNVGDRLKLLKILQWGLYGVNEPDQTGAFYYCENITDIAGDGAWFDVVTNGDNMFRDNNLTSLPAGMDLPNLTNGGGMFAFNSLTSLPESMKLTNLTTQFSMFFKNNLTSLPEGMELPNLTNGTNMFRLNSLTSLPAGMELPNLTNGNNMFYNNNLTSLPSGMELPNLAFAYDMFFGNTINTERYSQLLIDLEANNPNNNVQFHGGNSKYNTQGEIARNALLSRGWSITDGGLE